HGLVLRAGLAFGERRSLPCEVLGGCPDAPRPSRPAHLPQFPRGQAHTGWAEKNEIRIPHRSIYIGSPRLDVYCCRSGPRDSCAWYLAYGYDMLPGGQPCVIVTTLDNIRDGPAVNPKTEPRIPSEVCRPENE